MTIPRPELPAVRVPRELEVITGISNDEVRHPVQQRRPIG